MNFWRVISRLLAVFVIVGLVAASLATPVAAQRLAIVEMGNMSGISADMACYPETQKSNDCQDCPLPAMCMLSIAQAEPALATGPCSRCRAEETRAPKTALALREEAGMLASVEVK